jgi:hypothetical protein
MKKILAGILVGIMLLLTPIFSSCSTSSIPSHLNVSVSQEPVGGYNISSLTCVYKVTYTHSGTLTDANTWKFEGKDGPPPDPVSLKVVWINDKGGKYNEQELVFSTESKDKKSGTYTTTWKTPQAGQVFDKPFWVRFSWSDADGNHEQDSVKAICNVR